MEPAGFDPKALSTAAPLDPPLLHAVRFQDVDAAGIVFFARIVEYFHDAFAAYLRAHGQPLEVALAQKLWVAPIRESHVHFFKPLRFGDALTTSLVKSHLDGSDLYLGYRVAMNGAAHAVGYTRALFVDPGSFRRAAPPPAMVHLWGRLPAP